MKNITDGNMVSGWINQKQQLECDLAWELLEIFNNNNELITPLRNMANEALNELKQLKSSSWVASAAITKAWQSQKEIVQLCKKHPEGFNSIVVNQLDAQECSDMIRLYGEFIEKVGAQGDQGMAGPGGDYLQQESIKDSYRVGADRWNKKLSAGYGRHRNQTTPGMQSTSDVHSAIISQKGGAARFELCDSSTVNRIDHVFGLVPLADISGTTTDSIYYTERFSGPTGGDPIFYLLPLATLVANSHHSFLEVALSLTINKCIDYRIGFYSTLFPDKGVRGAGAIQNALAKAEFDARNRHMLVYYASGDNTSVPNLPSGCFLFDSPTDKETFKDFAKCVEILDGFQFMLTWPNEQSLREYCHYRHGLEI